MIFFIGILLVLISFFIFFNKKTKENEALFASFSFVLGFTLGLTNVSFQIYWVFLTMIPLIVFIIARTYSYLKNQQL